MDAPREYHFVNKDGSSATLTREQGHAKASVFRHVQTGTRKPRRKKVVRVQVPVISARRSHIKRPSVLRPLGASQVSRNDYTKCDDETETLWSILKPILYRGCSDPFDAQAIAINPRTNQLIVWTRDTYLHGLYNTPFFQRLTASTWSNTSQDSHAQTYHRPSWLRDWNQLRQGLSTKGGALAWLSSYIPPALSFMLGAERHKWQLWGLEMYNSSVRLLRQPLADMTPTGDELYLTLHMVWLFRADCVRDMPESAQVHAPVLRVLTDAIKDPAERNQLLMIVLFNDVEASVRQMRPTLFDCHDWAGKHFSALWAASEQFLPLEEETYPYLHPSISWSSTREIAVRLKKVLTLGQNSGLQLSNISAETADSIFMWAATRTICDMALLLNSTFDDPDTAKGQISLAGWYTEVSLALAVLLVLRRSLHSAVIRNVDVRDLSHVIVKRLRHTIKKAITVSSPDDRRFYVEAHLWIMCIGTQQEVRVNQERAQRNLPPTSWWSNSLRKKILPAKYHKLKSMLGMLQKSFVQNDFLDPDFDTWFDVVFRDISTKHQRPRQLLATANTTADP